MDYKIKLSNIWLRDIISQFFVDVSFVEEENLSDLLILEEETRFIFVDKGSMKQFLLDKPLNIKEVVSLINFLKLEKETLIVIAKNFFFNPSKRICILNAVEHSLTQKENEILQYLVGQNDFVDKQKLLEDIWGYSDDINTKTLETHIYKLKLKLGEDIIISEGSNYKILR
jgi:DNA-binding response OmpR family regulator